MPDDDLDFLQERITDQRHFGEISAYHPHPLPVAYACMAELCDHVRFLFPMRDSTAREHGPGR